MSLAGLTDVDLSRGAGQRGSEPLVLQTYAVKCAMHHHVHTMVRQMLVEGQRITNSF